MAILRLSVLSQSLEVLVQDAGLAPQLRGLVKPALEALERIGDLALSLEFTETSVRLTLSERLPRPSPWSAMTLVGDSRTGKSKETSCEISQLNGASALLWGLEVHLARVSRPCSES